MKKLFVMFLAVVVLFVGKNSFADDKNLIIATATPGGTYYPVGVAIGTLISIKLKASHGIQATAINRFRREYLNDEKEGGRPCSFAITVCP